MMITEQPRGPVLFMALYVAAIVLTILALFMHERFGATEFKAWAPFFQAVLSAAAIFSAWWLQSQKREADRRDVQRDTVRTIKAVTLLLETEVAHVIGIARRGTLTGSTARGLARGLRECDNILRKQNLGHLPTDNAVQEVVNLMQAAEKIASALEVPDIHARAIMPSESFEEAYRRLFRMRSRFLEEIGAVPEKRRAQPDSLLKITPETPLDWPSTKPASDI